MAVSSRLAQCSITRPSRMRYQWLWVTAKAFPVAGNTWSTDPSARWNTASATWRPDMVTCATIRSPSATTSWTANARSAYVPRSHNAVA
jgi:hypothetical protein